MKIAKRLLSINPSLRAISTAAIIKLSWRYEKTESHALFQLKPLIRLAKVTPMTLEAIPTPMIDAVWPDY
jgi:hypothetical protein